VQEVFGIVLFVVVAASAVAAVVALIHTGRTYGDIGRGGPSSAGVGMEPPSAGAREDEIRQMLGARNARRAARGEPPVDVDAELAALARAAADPALEAEVREHVAAMNRRRIAAGRPPLDADAEVARRLGDS